MTQTTSSNLVATLRRVPPLWWDAVVAVAAFALALVQLVGQHAAAEGFRSNDALAVVLLALQTLPLAFRRRAPLVVLGVLLVALLAHTQLGYEDGIGTATPLLALFTVAAQRGSRQSVQALSMVGAGIVGFGIFSRRDPGAVTLIIVALTYVAVWLLGALLRSRQQLQAESERRLELLETEQDLRAREAVVRHRTALALELHDAVGHGVSAMLLQAGAGRAVLESGGSLDVARDALVNIESSGRRTMGELDRMLGMLHGDDAAPEPGLRSLPDLALESKALGLDVAVHVTGEPRPISQEADRAAYRIVQEALTNAGKHGASEAVEVQVAWSPGALEIEIVSSLAGVPTRRRRRGPGRGLDGMAERARLAGGTFRAGQVDNGWSVAVRLPVPAG
jgi:signal transduction histidine kinase